MGNRHFFYPDSPCFILAFVIVNGYNTGKGGCVCGRPSSSGYQCFHKMKILTFHDIVSAGKTDSNGQMKLFSALQWMQDCSVLSFMEDAAFCEWLAANHVTPVVNFRQLEVVPSLKEKLTCSTYVYDIQGSFGYRNTAIYDAQGNPCYKSWVIAAFVNLESGRLSRIPKERQTALQFPPRLDMTYSSRKIVLPDTPLTPMAPFRVQRNDIDYNNHVNNAQYIRMALEYLPEAFQVSGLRVEYKRPVMPGSMISPSVIYGADTVYVVLAVEETACCVVEFTARS